MPHDDNSLSAQEVADILRVSRNTVYNLVKAGQLQSFSVGRKMRFTMADVDAYIAARRQRPAVQAKGEAPAAPRAPQKVPRALGTQRAQGAPLRIAGNDLAADVVANYLGQAGVRAERVYENCHSALVDLYYGQAEAALVHLYDRKTGRFNVPYVQRLVPGVPLVVLQVATRRIGLLVRAGNPLGLRKWRDLLREGVVVAVREPGAAERVLLDEQLTALEAGERPRGYERPFASPFAAATLVAQGGADVCIGTERTFHQVDGLDFLPLAEEELALAVLKAPATARAVQFLRRVMASRGFKEEVARTPGMDAARCGQLLYEV